MSPVTDTAARDTRVAAPAYHFLPWVRWGAGAQITAPVLGKAAAPPAGLSSGRASVLVKLAINGRGMTDAPPLALYGPGDVVGVDARAIVRTEPRPSTAGFPAHLFPFIEFDRPDFPWLFTPGAPDQDGCLCPWLVLIVVAKNEASLGAGQPLPVLSCRTSQLPDLAESWAWAHAQYTGVVDEDGIAGALVQQSDQSVSRLVCARRLRPGLDYHACVVPAFGAGRAVGLGEVNDSKAPWFAWDASKDDEIRLPVYYHWEFTTGGDEDFQQLVLGLRKAPTPPSSSRIMEVSWPKSPSSSEQEVALLPVASALYALADTGAHPGAPEALKRYLDGVLRPRVGALSPPTYGSWQVSSTGTVALDGKIPWITELNRDPTYRVAACLGAQVVQQQQESLMAAAWEQVGELEAVQQWQVQKQLGRAVIASTHQALQPASVSPEGFWRITEPLALPDTARSAARASGTSPAQRLHDVMRTGAYRRMTRPLGPVGRRLTTARGPQIREAPRAAAAMPARVSFLEAVVPPLGATAGAVVVSGQSLEVANASPIPPPDPSALYAALDAWTTFAGEAATRVDVPAQDSRDPLRPIRVAPAFSRPMYEPLRDLFRDSLLPGLDQIPNNSVAVLKADAKFIEAYMVGLNHEMSRELLWREFPADLQSTYFAQFWDGSASPGPDLPEIRSWRRPLGQNIVASHGSALYILLIRGDLLIRYPDAVIYAARAEWSGGQAVCSSKAPVPASLRVDPVPGVTLLGFALTPPPTDAQPTADDPGWYFVFEEHPTETRFGLEPSKTDDLSWRNLSWSDVSTDPGSQYVSVKRGLAATPSDPETTWGANSAHMAYIALKRRYRKLIHSSTWFAPPSKQPEK